MGAVVVEGSSTVSSIGVLVMAELTKGVGFAFLVLVGGGGAAGLWRAVAKVTLVGFGAAGGQGFPGFGTGGSLRAGGAVGAGGGGGDGGGVGGYGRSWSMIISFVRRTTLSSSSWNRTDGSDGGAGVCSGGGGIF